MSSLYISIADIKDSITSLLCTIISRATWDEISSTVEIIRDAIRKFNLTYFDTRRKLIKVIYWELDIDGLAWYHDDFVQLMREHAVPIRLVAIKYDIDELVKELAPDQELFNLSNNLLWLRELERQNVAAQSGRQQLSADLEQINIEDLIVVDDEPSTNNNSS
jgi:hypothetical protein